MTELSPTAIGATDPACPGGRACLSSLPDRPPTGAPCDWDGCWARAGGGQPCRGQRCLSDRQCRALAACDLSSCDLYVTR